MLIQQKIPSTPFKLWIWKEKENKYLLYFSIIVMTISFAWLKILYPYPNFMPPDSYNYLEAAQNNDLINFWPIGYSKFLRLISVFTRSHMILVALQYALLIMSVLFFLFTIRYLLSPGKWLFRIIIAVSIANPLLVHIANFISSDSVFAALSVIWITQLLWIIYKPTPLLLILHAAIVLQAFMLRYAAIYYPLISLLIIFIFVNTRKHRLLGICSITIAVFSFIGSTQSDYQRRTGSVQFAAFGGWQLAANALYGYAFDKVEPSRTVPPLFRELHEIVNHHVDSIKKLPIRPDLNPGIYYLWDFKSPLHVYLEKEVSKNKKEKYFENWASVAPLYNHYGRWLIRRHLGSFLIHFAWPNLIRYYNPPSSFMGSYNLGKNTVEPIAVNWFNWRNNKLPSRIKDKQITIMDNYPILLSIITPLFFLFFLFFVLFNGFKNYPAQEKSIILTIMTIWFINMIFSVFSAPIELRYQIFPIIITLPFLLLFISWLVPLLNIENKKSKQFKIIPELKNDPII